MDGADRLRRSALLLLALVSVAWLWLGAYQSHSLSGLRLLGDSGTTTLFGEPREGRGDEWSTWLPLLKQAQHEGFPDRSALEPYRERFDWFIRLPHADASLLLLPNQAIWWLASPGTALSFQGLYYNLLLLFSAYWLLRNLGVRTRLAMAAGVVLLFSHLYQAWWTSNFPCLGAALLPYAVASSRLRWRLRGPLLAWSTAHMLLGQLYPPFYLSLAFALLPFIAAVRGLRWRSVLAGSASILAGCAVVGWITFDYLQAVAGTTYPGMRISTGGDSSAAALLAVFFPGWPLPGEASSGMPFYEFGVAGSFFALLALAALPGVDWTRNVRRTAVVSLAVLAMMALYMLFGFPEPLAKATGFFVVPGRRMQFGFSVLVLFLSAYLLSNARTPRAQALLLVFGSYALVALLAGVRPAMPSWFAGEGAYPYLCLGLPCAAGLASRLVAGVREPGRAMAAALVCGMPLAHVAIYGTFNPLMRAADIMRPVDSQLVRDWKALHAFGGGRPIAVPGDYGNLLRGEGLEAMEAIHLANVDEADYARAFPELPRGQVGGVFDRLLGIGFENLPRMRKLGLQVTFPLREHAVAFPHAIATAPPADPPLGGPVRVSLVEPRGNGLYAAYWNGSLDMPLPIDAPLALYAPCSIEASWLTRFPYAVPALPRGQVALRGVAGELVVAAGSTEAAAKCARGLALHASTGAPARVPAAP